MLFGSISWRLTARFMSDFQCGNGRREAKKQGPLEAPGGLLVGVRVIRYIGATHLLLVADHRAVFTHAGHV